MDQSSALLATWMQGASISTIHFLIEQPEHVIEDQLRKALHQLRDAEAAPPAPVEEIAPRRVKTHVVLRNGRVFREPVAAVDAASKPKPGQAMRDKMAGECDVKRAKPSTPKTAPTSLVKSEAGLGPEELRGYPVMMRRADSSGPRKIYQDLKSGPKTLDEMVERLNVSYDTAWKTCTKLLAAGLASKTDDKPYRWMLVARPADAATGD